MCQKIEIRSSKMKKFCETASIFEIANVKNEEILRDFLQKRQGQCIAHGLVPMRFAIFPLHLAKVMRLPRKSEARSYEVLHLSRKSTVANLTIWYSKMQPLSGNQCPDLLTVLTCLMEMSLALPLPRAMNLCRYSSNIPRLPSFSKLLQNPHASLSFGEVENPLGLPRQRGKSKSGQKVCF